jgi:hypothetical protein
MATFPVNETGLNQDDFPLNQIRPGAAVSKTQWVNYAPIDRELYGTRFRTIASESRFRDDERTQRYYENPTVLIGPNYIWHVPAYGILFTVPQAIPGSDNVTTTSSGSGVGDLGRLIFRVNGCDAEVELGIRPVVLDGSGGLSSAGSWSAIQLDLTAAGFTGGSNGYAQTSLPYPVGTTPGDLFQAYVAYYPNNAPVATNPGRLYSWEIIEPPLLNTDP